MKTTHHHETDWLHLGHFDVSQIIGGLLARYPATSEFTFQYEGGYVNDPDDPGGCTNMGITIHTLEAWRGEPVDCVDVANLTKLEAQLIYATNYWAPIWGNSLPVGVNTQVYDWGVNSGPSTSVKHLQKLVGTAQDGIMGPNTLDMTKKYCEVASTKTLILELQEERQTYYESLANFPKYGNGWTSRNNACTSLALDLEGDRLPAIIVPTEVEERLNKLEQWAASFS